MPTEISSKGWGGHSIFVFPDLDTVIVFTGGNYIPILTAEFITNSMMNNYVLPAVISSDRK